MSDQSAPAIDVHCHIGTGARATGTEVELLKKLRESNVAQCVVSPIQLKTYNFDTFSYAEQNNAVAALAKKQLGKVIPFGRINPASGKAALDETKRVFTKLNLAGIKLQPSVDGYSLSNYALLQVLAEAEKHNAVILIHTGLNRVDAIAHPLACIELTRQFKGLKFILAHAAALFQDAYKQGNMLSNVWFDTSIHSTPFTISNYVEQYGDSRLLFGSDYPYSDPFIERLKIERADLPESSKRRILFENAKRLFQK